MPLSTVLHVANLTSQSCVLSDKQATYSYTKNHWILELIHWIEWGNWFHKYVYLFYTQFCLSIVTHNLIKCYFVDCCLFFLLDIMLWICIWSVKIWICIGCKFITCLDDNWLRATYVHLIYEYLVEICYRLWWHLYKSFGQSWYFIVDWSEYLSDLFKLCSDLQCAWLFD